MGSGHTNRRRRGGGGNSRARHGPQRQQNPEARNGQVHPVEPIQATQTATAPAQPAPRQAPREQAPREHEPRPEQAPRPEHEPRRYASPAQSRAEAPAPNRAIASGNGRAQRPPVVHSNSAHNGFKGTQSEQSALRAEDEEEAEAGAAPLVRQYSYNGSESREREIRPEVRGELAPLIDALRELFQRDRAVASQGNSTRCGICYLHFTMAELEYREAEGFYVCAGCKQALTRASLPMIRRQQR